jgi:GMP synthase (glutamine-hydrolysing)
VIVLRAVQTVDFVIAHRAHLQHELLDVCSRRIVNKVKGTSRVVHDISGKPPATIDGSKERHAIVGFSAGRCPSRAGAA